MTNAVPSGMVNVRRAYVHSTWAGTFSCRPELFFQPGTLDQIKAILETAKKNGKTIMLTGSGHSPSILTMTDDWLVNLDKFNMVLEVEPHSSGKWTDVTVEAGIRIYQLNEFLKTKGLGLQNLGSISDQSIAGIISTGTHGSSAYHGLVSQQIVSFKILTAAGEHLTCSPTENRDLFRAGLISLGRLGVITHATVRTIPLFNLESVAEIVSFDKFIDELWPAYWTSSEYTRVWWYPYAKQVVLWRADKSDKPISKKSKSFYDTTLGRFFYEGLLWIAVKCAPSLTPKIERWVFGRQYGYTDTYGNGKKTVYDAVEGLNMDCLFSQFVNEWALPLQNGVQVLRELEQLIDTAAETGEFYVHSPFEVRISNTTSTESIEQPDSSLVETNARGPVPGNNLRPLLDGTPRLPYAPLTQVTEKNLTLYLNATVYRPFGVDTPIQRWYTVFEQVMTRSRGKPHWAKNFLGTKKEQAGRVYGDGEMRGLEPIMDEWFGKDVELWRELRRKHDPDGLFVGTNDWLEINGLL